MTELQFKINTVQKYLHAKGKRTKEGKPIRIVFKDGDNTEELRKIDMAFLHARKYFGI